MKTTPFWWDDAPREDTPFIQPPVKADVAIVGAGFSGLSTALVLARAGLSVVVFEAGQLGTGGSSRNGGMVGSSFHKLGLQGLKDAYGEEKTNAIVSESVGFVDFIEGFLKSENIDAEFKRVGRFRGAMLPDHFAKMVKELDIFRDKCGIRGFVVPPKDLPGETGSPRFHGGVVYDMDGGLHPAKFHNGLIANARAAGVTIIANCPVTGISKNGDNHTVSTPYGTTVAQNIAICTNAYTGPQFPQLRRRILPMRSAMIATQELPADLMARLFPKSRVCGDSRRVVAYYRPSPDGKRILFGGRAARIKDTPQKNARQLHGALAHIFPELETTRVSHVWSGLVGYTFDHAPHVGEMDGMYYAMGFCGSGVARATYFGQKLGYKILGQVEKGRTAFDDLPFQARPLYNGNPWFMPAVLGWHRVMDRFGR